MLSIDDQGPPPACPAPFNLAEYVLAPAGDRPDKIALAVLRVSGADRWSYARLSAAVTSAAAHLAARGIGPGDRVALRLSNSPDLPVAFLAAAWIGAVPVLIPEPWTPPEIAAALALTSPALILNDPALALPDRAAPILPISNLRHDAPAPPPHRGDPNRPGYIVFTSGTEGRSKPVLHAHRAIHARRMMWAGWYGLTPDDRILHPGAFNWTYTLGTGLLDPWAAGATALIPAPGTDARALALLLRRHDVTIFAGAPAHYRRLLASSAPLDLPTLRHGLSAGEKLSDTLREAWNAATARPIYEAFGMSECSTFLSGAPGRPAPPGTLGQAQPGRRIAILDEAGTPAPRGTPGRLAIDATDPGLMLGYLGDPPLARTGWYVTADMAEMSETGAITYLGRADDMMNAGGVRVSPQEVEAVLRSFPGIDDCAVMPVTVRAETSVIAAFFQSAAAPDMAALEAHMAARLAAYKRPRLYERLDALPRTATGKLNRRALRDGWKART
ncbi:class I adenylate-forming enzyme family protein [Ovoidimarina sediminis]|uniref:class I adenylate-forming enzyme family protein n=1 Tax=Ovoidimarina sediminis TaxID=3079856 RepID=UPI00290ACC43|nr:class I adenylate-forming enzyme family protein [Rhodophyticola sp. MJ-SS7]MDU8941885.1 class I adenylate-forming enzyme family protein [Rhodophyticola sp. MJ-SS7]